MSIGSVDQPAIRRVGTPDKMQIRPAIDDTLKNKVHGFERSGRCDKIQIFSRLPITPTIKIPIEMY